MPLPQPADACTDSPALTSQYCKAEFGQPFTAAPQMCVEMSSRGSKSSALYTDFSFEMQERGVQDILAVDLTRPMLDALAQQLPPSSTLGNEPAVGCFGFVSLPFASFAAVAKCIATGAPRQLWHHTTRRGKGGWKLHVTKASRRLLLCSQVRTWCGDIVDLPAAQGTADAVFFNAMFGNVFDQHEALGAACRLLRPGGHVIISHPLGRRESRELQDIARPCRSGGLAPF